MRTFVFGLGLLILQGCNPQSKEPKPAEKKNQKATPNSKPNSDASDSTSSNSTSHSPVTTLRTSATDESRNTCGKICARNSKCQESAAKSFCKWDQERPACFSLYWTDKYHEKVCHVRDQNCPQTHPVECGIVDDSRQNVIGTVNFLIDADFKKNSCQGLCEHTANCARSSCLDNLDFPICTNLYWADGRISQASLVYETDAKKAKRDNRVPVECGVVQYVTKHKKPGKMEAPAKKKLAEVRATATTVPAANRQTGKRTTTTTTTSPATTTTAEMEIEEPIEELIEVHSDVTE